MLFNSEFLQNNYIILFSKSISSLKTDYDKDGLKWEYKLAISRPNPIAILQPTCFFCHIDAKKMISVCTSVSCIIVVIIGKMF